MELRGDRVVLRDATPADAAALRAMHRLPEVAAWWGQPADDFPFEDDQYRLASLVIEDDGELAGYIQLSQEHEPEYFSAWIDLFVDPARHGRGIGREAIRIAIRHLVEDRGHHRITIDPATDNAPAIRCYEGAGFRRVGVMEAAWRDFVTHEWRDTLFMELVVRK